MCTYCNPATSKEAPSCGKRPPASCWRGCCFVVFIHNNGDPEETQERALQFLNSNF